MDRDAFGIELTGEQRGVDAPGDVRDLRRREGDHVVVLTAAVDDVEVVEVAPGRTGDDSSRSRHVYGLCIYTPDRVTPNGDLPREAQRAGGVRVRRVAAICGDRGLVRRRDPAASGRALLPPGGRGAEPRDDDRPVPARLRPRGRDPGRRGAEDVVRGRA